MNTAIVTGSSQGLGKGFVDNLASTGYTVFACTTDTAKIIATENIIPIELDVISNESIKKAVREIGSKTDHIDILINNAGVNKDTVTNNQPELVSKLSSIDRESMLKMFDVNTVSPLILVKHFLPLLEKSSQSFVINVSSCRASYHDEFANNNPNYGYSSSKIALNMITSRLVKELPENIQTFAVHPGDITSTMNPEGDSEPRLQAKKIIEITDNWRSELNGEFLRYDGTFYRL